MIKNKKLFEDYDVEEKNFFTRFKKPRSITLLFTTIIGIFLFILFYNNAVGRMSLEELGDSLRVVWQDTSWVNTKVSSGKVKIVPTISIRVKNVGKRPLAYLNFISTFDLIESGKRLDDSNVYVFVKPLQPGETSKDISLTSKFGYTASTNSAFAEHEEKWQPVKATIYAKTSAGFLKLGEYQIKKVIVGLEEEIKLKERDDKKEKIPLQAIYHDSRWLDKKVTGDKVVVVPSVTLKLKNVGSEPMRSVYLKAVFEVEESGATFGEGFRRVLKKGLKPGQTSREIVLASDFGSYTARSKADFIKNKQLWEKVRVRVLVKINYSGFKHLGTYHVRQALEGVQVIYRM